MKTGTVFSIEVSTLIVLLFSLFYDNLYSQNEKSTFDIDKKPKVIIESDNGSQEIFKLEGLEKGDKVILKPLSILKSSKTGTIKVKVIIVRPLFLSFYSMNTE